MAYHADQLDDFLLIPTTLSLPLPDPALIICYYTHRIHDALSVANSPVPQGVMCIVETPL